MLDKMTLRAGIYGAFSVVLLFFVLFVGIGILHLREVNEQLNGLLDTKSLAVQLSEQMQRSLVSLGSNEKSIVYAESREQLESYLGRGKKYENQLTELNKDIEPLLSADGKVILKSYHDKLAVYSEIQQQLIGLKTQAQAKKDANLVDDAHELSRRAVVLLESREQPLFDELEQSLGALETQNIQRLQEAKTLAIATNESARVRLVLWMVCVLLVGGGAAYWVLKLFRHRIKRMGERAESVATGDFTELEDVDDELRVISRAHGQLDSSFSKVMRELEAIIQASKEGDLKRRVQPDDFQGNWKTLMQGINTILDEAIGPVNAQAVILQKMAEGSLTVRVTENFKGDHNRIKDAINRIADIAGEAMTELNSMTQASRDGDLRRRTQFEMYSGDWRKIMLGVNVIMDEAIGPVSAQVAILQKMAEGTLTARVTDNFKGDHNRIKDAINRVADIADTAMVEMDGMIQASRDGNLTKRADINRFVGDWRILMAGTNTILDEAMGPVNIQVETLQKMAEGTLTARVTENFKGDHNRIKNAINRVADIADVAMIEMDGMIQASKDGDLAKRADVNRFVGDWRILMTGTNTILDEAIGPVNVQADILQKMAEGTLTARVTENFKGDHNRIKDAINRVADIADKAMVEMDGMIQASKDGDLMKRADVGRFVGDWRILMVGTNTILDEAIGPVNAQLAVLQRMAEGTLTARVTDNFKGDHNRIKESINRVAEIADVAMLEMEGMIQASRDGNLTKRADVGRFVGDWRILMAGTNTILDESLGPVNAQLSVLQKMAEGTLTARVTDNFKGDHNRIKDSINRVAEIADVAMLELDGMIQASREGNLTKRANVNRFVGDWRILMAGTNTILDESMGPVNQQLDVLQKMAEGTLTARVTENFKGDHNRIKNAINRVAEIADKAMLEMDGMIQASKDGDLSKRADVNRFVGDWRILMAGTNTILDEAIGPVNVQAAILQKMAEGTLTARVAENFKGDHNRIKDAINRVAEIADTAMLEMDGMIQASKDGNLTKRADVNRFVGDWRILMAGTNTILDEAMGPVTMQAAVLKQMAEGTLTARVNESFKGDHNRITDSINRVAEIANQALDEFSDLMVTFDKGDLEARAREDAYSGDWRKIMGGVNYVLANVYRTTEEVKSQNWIKTGLSELAEQMRGDLTLADLANQVVSYLARYLGAQIGAFYLLDAESKSLHLMGSYAYELRKDASLTFVSGEGLLGQAVLEKHLISVTDLPDDYVRVSSAIGSIHPRNLVVLPVMYEGNVKGVIELGSLHQFGKQAMELLQLSAEAVGIAVLTSESGTHTRVLLQQTQEQALKLQSQQETLQQANEELEEQAETLKASEYKLKVQQEELQQTNEELEEQAQSLKASEEKLKAQQEELQQTNEELEERTQMLESQGNEIVRKNTDLELAKADLQQQADDLAIASKYKSEFLANMSHELRTPLNSMLLLSRSLSDNRDGNLSEKQVQSAKVMHQSGNDLLGIINDILDLSKIEAGREAAIMGDVDLTELTGQLDALYQHVAEDKGVAFNLVIDPSLPRIICSDRQRLGQILRNLLSNSFKFTKEGSVTLNLFVPESTVHFHNETLNQTKKILALAVIDTGVGIPLSKQKHIWEAFQQADGSTSREYGGTGLGLTISRELAKLLNGEIHLSSEPGSGATFTLYLPMPERVEGQTQTELLVPDSGYRKGATPATHREFMEKNGAAVQSNTQAQTEHMRVKFAEHIKDDRKELTKDEGAILIVEDDVAFANILADLCRDKGVKFLACPTAEEALELLSNYTIIGVMLDMQLPERDGWVVLTRIKEQLSTLHIPVCVISAQEENRKVMNYGAVRFLTKPVTQEQLKEAYETITTMLASKVKSVLLIEDDENLRHAVHELLDASDVSIYEAGDGKSALETIKTLPLDLIVLDLGLPDMNGFDLLKQIRYMDGVKMPPVIIFTGRDLTRDEYDQLQQYTVNVIMKGERSDERLVEEAALFLHRRVINMPDRARKMLRSLHDRDEMFTGKTVLLVDDDIRNIFSLSGLLEDLGLKVYTAKNGQDALDKLSTHSNIDLVLTDIMMPVMDGYELIRQVRAKPEYIRLPILALTAKAMKEDRDRCMEVGASDYLSKPIDVDHLLSVMRVWLYNS